MPKITMPPDSKHTKQHWSCQCCMKFENDALCLKVPRTGSLVIRDEDANVFDPPLKDYYDNNDVTQSSKKPFEHKIAANVNSDTDVKLIFIDDTQKPPVRYTYVLLLRADCAGIRCGCPTHKLRCPSDTSKKNETAELSH